MGVATALEALIRPVLDAEVGDIVAVGASLVLTPDNVLISDAGLSLYRFNRQRQIENTDILDGMAEDYCSKENQIIRSLHFIMNTDYFFESDLRTAALEMCPTREQCVSMEFVMLGDALLLTKSDLTSAFLNRLGTVSNLACLGDVVRSLWYPPKQYPDRKADFYAAKSIKAFLEAYMPLRDKNSSLARIHVPFPEWHECATTDSPLPLLQTWNVSVA